MYYLVVYCSNSIFFEVGTLKEGGEDKTDNNAELVSRLKNIRKFLETMYNEL